MIQRKQTVFLVLGALSLLAILLFDGLRAGVTAERLSWFMPAVFGLSIFVALAALGAIFLYKYRDQQRKAILGVQVLTLILVVVLFVGFYMTDMLPVVKGASFDLPGIAVFALPIVAYFLFLLARKGVENDIKLIQSMDRLR